MRNHLWTEGTVEEVQKFVEVVWRGRCILICEVGL